MVIEQYDVILLKTGVEGSVVEAFENKMFIVDIGSSEKDWETLYNVSITQIAKVLKDGKWIDVNDEIH